MRDPPHEIVQTLPRGALRMGESQHVTMAPAIALAILEHLVGQALQFLIHVPAPDGALDRPSPATHVVHEGNEVQQMRPDASDPGQRLAGGPTVLRIAESRCHRQREQRRVVRRGPTADADLHDGLHGTRPVRLQATAYDSGVVQRQGTRGGVVRAALGSEDQEPFQANPVRDREDVAAGGVADHPGLAARDRLRLGRGGAVDVLENPHVRVSIRVMAH